MTDDVKLGTDARDSEAPALLTREILLSAMPELTDEQIKRFITYYDMLTARNRFVNLTRITEPLEVAQKHFADSLLASELIPHGARVVDVGTGAGFPGIPLKIVRPDISLVLVDSLAKRIDFLKELCAELGIDAAAVHARAEDAARDTKLRGRFDIAVSRAVAPMSILTELTVPFVKVGGSSLMYKGPNADEEIEACKNAFRELKCSAESVSFSPEWGERRIVIVKKSGDTPGRYPRKAGSIEKKPL